jgi:hypothetical protein
MNSNKRYFVKLPLVIVQDLANIKYKEILNNSKSLILKQWAEEYFEIAIADNDHYTVSNKLDEISDTCPHILSKNDKEIITVN